MTFKAFYALSVVPIPLDKQITSRNIFLLFLNNAGIPYVESRAMFMEGYVEVAKKYQPVIQAYSEYWMELAKAEEQFMAKVKEMVKRADGFPTHPPATPPTAGLPVSEENAKAGPEMKKVDSTNVDAIGYMHTTQTLRVKFTNGDVYEYAQVPADIAEGLQTARSPGGFLAAHIKGSFKYKKL